MQTGWKLDLKYFLYHGEKTLIKCRELDEEHYLEFKISYNYRNQAILHISKFYHKQGDNFASSNGLGKSVIINETPAKRKTIDKLISLTYLLSDNKLMDINKNTPVSSGYGIFVPSEDF